jgi:putative transposase
MHRLDPDCLVFIDETWIKTNMAPIRGWGIKGERLKGFAPDAIHDNVATLVSAIGQNECANYFRNAGYAST